MELDRAILRGGESQGDPGALERRRTLCERAQEKVRALLKSPGIAQRTPSWYLAREGMITASDVAQALGDAKFGTQKQFFQKKCGLPEERVPFNASCPPLKWGVMYEPVAQQLYTHFNAGVFVHEFGLLNHPTVPFLGASPDGITDLGVMIEIKCPWRRKILDKAIDEATGETIAEVPTQYYYQIQAQLEVCDLDECDYFECEFAEAEGWGEEGEMRGVVFELQQRTDSATNSSYVYPPLGLGKEALEHWLQAVEATAGVMCVNVVPHWWRLVKHQTVRIERDAEFISGMLNDLSEVWKRVLRYRDDRESYVSDGMVATTNVKNKVVEDAIGTSYAFRD